MWLGDQQDERPETAEVTEGLCETSSAAKDMDLHEEHAHAVAIHVQELGSKTPEKLIAGILLH